ncbi:MAG: chromosomal replication initiator protein DnaA [Eggerthellaceae bacterium]|jgi:chromosomal replication initiator protein
MQNLNYDEIWDDICSQIKSYQEVDDNQLVAFFSRLHLQAFSTGFVMLSADNEFIKSWIERHYLAFIKRALKDLYGQDFVVEIAIDNPEGTADTTQAEPQASDTAVRTGQTTSEKTNIPTSTDAYSSPLDDISPAMLALKRAKAASESHISEQLIDNQTAMPKVSTPSVSQPTPNTQRHNAMDNHLTRTIPTLTFSNYVIGDSNRMAYSMALAVAEKPGMPNLNPLFIYGKSGVGKTHLLRAIQNKIIETSKGFLKAVYVDSTEFINDYANASADHSLEKSSFKNFKQNYEDADVLLIDDVQSFQGKTQTLEIIFQLFNSLTSAGKQVVMSADIAPKNIDIDERYTSRFNQGATFDIQAPETETKQAIAQAFIREYQEHEEQFDLDIPNEVVEYIAENSSSNIRELKSAVTKIIYQMVYTNQKTITTDEVAKILENHFSGGRTKRLTVEDIQKEVESFYHVSHEDLISKKRTKNIIYARQVAMYLCRQMLENNAYQRIGDSFGKKDHTTVMYSVGLIETKVKENKEVSEEIDILVKNIRER